MTELQSFRLAICAEPLEDTPRIAYTDWLDDHERYEQAAFIRSMFDHWNNSRASCKMGRYINRYGSPKLTPGQAKRWGLWLWSDLAISTCVFRVLTRDFAISARSEYREDNGHPIAQRRVYVRRGFVEEVHCPMADLIAFASSVFREQPIRHVVLCDKEPAVVNGSHWNWYSKINEGVGPSLHIDDAIYDMLKPGALQISDWITQPKQSKARWHALHRQGVATYHSRQAALDAISDAACAFGRQAAGIAVEVA